MSNSIGFQPEALAKALGVRRVDLENGLTKMLDKYYSGEGGSPVQSVNNQIGDVMLEATDIPEDIYGDVQEAVHTLKTNIEQNSQTIDTLSDRVDDLEGITQIYASTFSNFNSPAWLDLTTGTYFMLGKHSVFTNQPFEDYQEDTVYILAIEIVNASSYYVHKLHVLAQGYDTPMTIYYRGGNNDVADLEVRQWADLTAEGTDGGGDICDYPVTSVNEQTGDVLLTASDIPEETDMDVQHALDRGRESVINLEKMVEALTFDVVVQSLEMSPYSNFKDIAWLTLGTGEYYLEGEFRDFSGVPTPSGTDPIDIVGLRVSLSFIDSRYAMDLQMTNMNSHSAPHVYSRGGKAIFSDFQIHQWADLTQEAGEPIDPLVTSVNTKIGDVVLSSADVQRPSGETIEDALVELDDIVVDYPVDSVNELTGDVILTASNVSRETGETIEDALTSLEASTPDFPVQSVNTLTGDVILTSENVPRPDGETIENTLRNLEIGVTTDILATDVKEDVEGNVQLALNANKAYTAEVEDKILAVDTKVDDLKAVDIAEVDEDNVQNALYTYKGKIAINTSSIDSLDDRVTVVDTKIDELTVATILDVGEYGDLNDLLWLDMENGEYSLEGAYSEFANLPFNVSTLSTPYALRLTVNNDGGKYKHTLTAFRQDIEEKPMTYTRSGGATEVDFRSRGWVLLGGQVMSTDVARPNNINTVEDSLVEIDGKLSGDIVTSVNTKSGDVVLTASDVNMADGENIQDTLDLIEESIAQGFEDLEALKNMIPLDIEEYGNLNGQNWLDLGDGGYYIEGVHSQFSNLPFPEEHPAILYGIRMVIHGSETKYLHEMFAVSVGDQTPPKGYVRGGANNLSDIMLRPWAPTTSTSGSGDRQVVSYYYDFEVDDTFTTTYGVTFNLSDIILSYTGTSFFNDGTVGVAPPLAFNEDGALIVPKLPQKRISHAFMHALLVTSKLASFNPYLYRNGTPYSSIVVNTASSSSLGNNVDFSIAPQTFVFDAIGSDQSWNITITNPNTSGLNFTKALLFDLTIT